MNVQALSRLFAIASTGMEGLVIILFLYVLLVPWIHAIEPDVGSFHYSHSRSLYILINNQYRSWRDSGILSSVIPILTVAILVGWSLLCFTLGRWSSLGYLQGAVGGELIIVQSDYIRNLTSAFQHQASMHSRLDSWAFSLPRKFTAHDYTITVRA